MKKEIIHLKKGFTLAELMAVVVIVGILAALALGSYTKSFERARFSEGLANAHALSAAIDAYYYDHNFTCPSLSNLFTEKLPVSLSNVESISDGTIKTKNFTYSYDTYGIMAHDRHGVGYAIFVYPQNCGSKLPQDQCSFSSSGAKTLCESVGYTSCSGSVCTKP